MTKPARLFEQESKFASFAAGDILDDTEKPFSLFHRCSFGLWLQTTPSGLSDTVIPSHSFYTTHLYTIKAVCMTAKWMHQLQYAASPCAWILTRVSEPSGCELQLHTALTWEYLLEGTKARDFSVPLFALVIPHIPRILHWGLLGIHQRHVLSCRD